MTADEVRARIESKRQELVDLIATIDEAALSAPGPDGGWAIKDHLVFYPDRVDTIEERPEA